MPPSSSSPKCNGLPVLDKAFDHFRSAATRRMFAAKVDYGTGLPFSLRVLMFWVSDWHRRERLVHMDVAAMIRKYGSTVLGCIGCGTSWLAALYLLASAAQNSAEFDRWLPWILLINISGLLTAPGAAGRKALAPGAGLSQARSRLGSPRRAPWRFSAPWRVACRLPGRFITFRCNSSNRGIDSWFELEVSQGLKDTRELSHAALEVRVREFLQHTQVVAHSLSTSSDLELIGTLDRERRESTALEFTIVGAQAQILATSSDQPMDTLPVPATDEMMLQLRRGRPYVSLDTDSVGGYLIRAAAPLDASSGGARVLIALYPVQLQLSQLADTVWQRSPTPSTRIWCAKFAQAAQIHVPY